MKRTIVTLPCRTIRAMGRRMCRGQYWHCVLILLVCRVVSSLPVYLVSSFTASELANEIASIAGTALSWILGLGSVTFFLAVFRGEKGSIEHVTSAFENKGKAIGTQLLVYIRVFVRMLLLIVPGIIEAVRDALALHVLSDHPEYTSSECILASRELMEGNKAKYVKLVLSFFGWALLASIPSLIHSSMFGPMMDSNALIGLTVEEMQAVFLSYQEELLAYQSQLVPTLLSLFSLLVDAYMAMTTAAFFDLACGNLVVQQSDGNPSEEVLDLDIQDISDYSYKDK